MHQSSGKKKPGLDIPIFGIVNMKILVKVIRLLIESKYKEKRNGTDGNFREFQWLNSLMYW